MSEKEKQRLELFNALEDYRAAKDKLESDYEVKYAATKGPAEENELYDWYQLECLKLADKFAITIGID